ncbi:DNA-binding IclR family transcriptional regulator [Comamonas odontotermitis]|uniref:DNA-binding IclR family transcriptional regulator n=1 Tax=Comamonas odontotermitis TaxID=379895 RepID=A0ABR6RAN7_9BURK|nr:IclR family transcriptional regulator [Comamonas odontotermitis]MBB6576214.1 DNA-binding IclR family transcriptional regulator [Comamonas odontotermitis]
MDHDNEDAASHQRGTLHRSFVVLRALAAHQKEGVRVTHLAKEIGLTQATTHRLLQGLVQEGVVEQDQQHKLYRLGLDLFSLAALAGGVQDLRSLARPVLLRLSASLSDTVILLVRSGFDAVCLDRIEGQFPIRTFTGDIGGRVPLGVGQGSLAILANLPDAEREEVLRYNLPRIQHYNVYDEVYMRTEIDRTLRQGYTARNSGLLEGMAGLAAPVFDRNGHVVAALSIGTHTARLNEERLPAVRDMLLREAKMLSSQINPFDPTLRHPMHALSTGDRTRSL